MGVIGFGGGVAAAVPVTHLEKKDVFMGEIAVGAAAAAFEREGIEGLRETDGEVAGVL